MHLRYARGPQCTSTDVRFQRFALTCVLSQVHDVHFGESALDPLAVDQSVVFGVPALGHGPGGKALDDLLDRLDLVAGKTRATRCGESRVPAVYFATEVSLTEDTPKAPTAPPCKPT
jgi:hypothetical protein